MAGIVFSADTDGHELVEAICEQFRLSQSMTYAEWNLATLSRTARVFHVPALSALWHTQRTVENVVGLLPADILAVGTVVSDYPPTYPSRLLLMRPPLDEELDRYRFYAPFIKELYIGYDTWSYNMNNICRHLFRKNPLPSICSLHWHTSPHNLRHIGVFLSANTREVTLLQVYNSSELLPALGEIKRTCIALSSVGLDMRQTRHGKDLDLAFADFLADVPIRHLRLLSSFSDGCLAGVARLCDLVSLQLTEAMDGQYLVSGSFPRLRELTIFCLTFGFAESLISALLDSPLESLLCTYEPPWTATQQGSLLLRIAAAVQPATLRALRVVMIRPTRRQSASAETSLVTFSAIQPLLIFRNLEVLVIDTQNGCNFTDNELQTMGTSWPGMIRLDLAGCRHSVQQPRATLQGLVRLASLCPRLKQLTVVFDARNTSETLWLVGDSSLDLRGLVHHGLTKLEVGASLADETIDVVAQILRRVFPKLESVALGIFEDYASMGDSDAWLWRGVTLKLKKLVDAICEQLRLSPHEDGGNSALARLSRTAHTFEVPALSALWHTQRALENVVRLLPEDVLATKTPPHGDQLLTMVRAPLYAELDRYRFYAPFIKALHIDLSGFHGLDEDTICQLLFERNPLPSVRSLQWRYRSLRHINVFLNPGIRAILIKRGCDGLRDALIQIKRTCVALDEIELEKELGTPQVAKNIDEAFADVLARFSGIRHLLMCSPLGDRCLALVGKLSELVSLKLQEGAPGQYLASGSFPRLRELTMQCITFRFADTLVGALQNSPLESLSCNIEPPWTAMQQESLLFRIAAAVQPATLRSLRVFMFSGRHPLLAGTSLVTFSAVQPLLIFRNLEVIIVRTPDGCIFLVHHHLRELEVGMSSADATVDAIVAQILQRIFPQLDSVMTGAFHAYADTEDVDRYAGWGVALRFVFK
ncbi:hypothetical protein BD626DRAFT_629614 [Schizophyllum amplum]|uniref:F-box domain-containing protein n=1 Tax=Schizophyllum amplum TaxID=97359 RepID=A0A550CG95_9AGAR|nr:hypothetical protein BD626DRAFT_629614 [Auriculariopsis ampla]